MDMEDQRLVAAARRGSREAAAELFDLHWDRAWRLAYAITRSPDAADDVAQEAFERAFRSLGGFDGRSSFATWLSRIAINAALTVRRREQRVVLGYLGEGAGASFGPPDRELVDAVDRLSAERRVAVILRYWLDLSPAEIAELLDVPRGTVHSRLARALAELRSNLEVTHVESA